MANRPVFVVKEEKPFVETVNVDFVWNSGLSKSQKQKNIAAIHKAFEEIIPGKKTLEISSKSYQDGGKELSAFSLKKYVPSLGKAVPVECVFQAGKVYAKNGPFPTLMNETPRRAKEIASQIADYNGRIVGFSFEGKEFPSEPKTAFYDFIYINALLENPDISNVLLQFDAFTDIEFNPNKSLNCQARAAAVFVGLSRAGLTDLITDFDKFLNTVYDP